VPTCCAVIPGRIPPYHVTCTPPSISISRATGSAVIDYSGGGTVPRHGCQRGGFYGRPPASSSSRSTLDTHHDNVPNLPEWAWGAWPSSPLPTSAAATGGRAHPRRDILSAARRCPHSFFKCHRTAARGVFVTAGTFRDQAISVNPVLEHDPIARARRGFPHRRQIQRLNGCGRWGLDYRWNTTGHLSTDFRTAGDCDHPATGETGVVSKQQIALRQTMRTKI